MTGETDTIDVQGGLLGTPAGDNTQETPEHNQSEADKSGDTWITGLPDELQETVKAKSWKTPADVLKSYTELEKYSSKNVQDMTPEEREKFTKRLGRPEKPDGYELTTLVLPKGVEKPTGGDKAYREIVHELGLSQEQAKRLHEWAGKNSVDAIIASRQAVAKKRDEAETVLRREWALNYDGNIKDVEALIRAFGGDDVVAYMNTGPGKEPVMQRFLQKIKGSMSEETFVEGTTPVKESTTVPGGFDWSKVPSVSGENRFGKRE